MDTSINKANEVLMNDEDPTMALITLSDDIDETELASGNIAQLDETVKLAIDKQRKWLNSTEEISQDQSSRNFTNAVLNLTNILLGNDNAFWGLDSILREEAVDSIQKNIDETLFLLAQNLIIGTIYRNENFTNLGII